MGVFIQKTPDRKQPMIEKLIHASLHNRTLVLVLVFGIVAAGAWSLRSIPIDAFPDVTGVQVELVGNAPGLSPLEIERFVTYPIETGMRGLPGLERIRSVTKYGLCVVTLVFRDDVDTYFARHLVFERLTSASHQLPAGVDVEMGPVATAMGEIYQYTLDGPRPRDPEEQIRYLTDLRTLQDWVVSPLLKGVPGVNEVNSFGGYLREFQVNASPERLAQYGISIRELVDALGRNNQNVGGSFIEQASEQFIVRGVGVIANEADIGSIVVKNEHQGIPVFVKDVARVGAGHSRRQGLARRNLDGETVGGIVMMLKGENGLEVVRRVEERVKEINSGNVLPEGTKVVPYYQRSDIVGSSIGTAVRALAEGAGLVLIVLYLLLLSVRGAVAVLLALPLSVLLTFTVMRAFGLSGNLMSLGGLAISIGMIIDATIIQVENAHRHLAEMSLGEDRLETVKQAVLEVRKPSIFGELIIALTFVPIVTLQGMEGKMFSPLALTVTIALLASLFLSIFVIPALCSILLKPEAERPSPILAAARRLYLPVIRFGIRVPLLVAGGSLALFLAAGLLLPHLGTEFVPTMDEGAFDMDFQLLPGVSVTRAGEVAQLVHERLMKFPELSTLVSRTGQTGIALEARGVDKTGMTGVLKPRDQWTTAKSKEELLSRMRDALSDIPGMAFSFSQPIQCRIDELVAGTRAQIVVKVFGQDSEVLKKKAGELAGVIARVPGATDLVVEEISGQPYITVQVDRDRIARYGINVADVLEVVEIAVGGKTATSVYEENRAFDLRVQLEPERRDSVEKIRNLLVKAQNGPSIPLEQLATVSLGQGPVQITREDGQRRLGIEMNITGRDIGSFVAEAQKAIRRHVKLPPGYTVTWGGQFENQQRAVSRLALIMPAVIGLILLLLYLTFQSIRLALLVFLNLPFAQAGGLVALWAAGLYLSVPASVGFIVLLGVAVLNGLVLVSYIWQLRRTGTPVEQATIEACEHRLRPILMTACITVFSLIPMLYATGPGSEIQKPLAVVVVGGLITSTLSTLLVMPSMYRWFDAER